MNEPGIFFFFFYEDSKKDNTKKVFMKNIKYDKWDISHVCVLIQIEQMLESS